MKCFHLKLLKFVFHEMSLPHSICFLCNKLNTKREWKASWAKAPSALKGNVNEFTLFERHHTNNDWIKIKFKISLPNENIVETRFWCAPMICAIKIFSRFFFVSSIEQSIFTTVAILQGRSNCGRDWNYRMKHAQQLGNSVVPSQLNHLDDRKRFIQQLIWRLFHRIRIRWRFVSSVRFSVFLSQKEMWRDARKYFSTITNSKR